MQFAPGEINIVCTNLEKSEAFYCDVLGFEKRELEQGALHLELEGVRFLLLPYAEQGVPAGGYLEYARISFDLVVEDIGAAYDFLCEGGVDIEEEWREGEPMFVIRDPDGHCVEIIQG